MHAFTNDERIMTSLFRNSAVLLAAVLAGCGTKPSAKAAVPDSARAANGDVAKGAAPANTNANASQATPAAKSTGASTSGDSTRPHLNPGRTAHDSESYASAIRAGMKMLPKWPAGPAPLPGSLFPAKRIVAFYGNPLVKKMGVLGEYPVDQMLAKLDTQVTAWEKADPSTPVQPALHLIAVVAQGAPGKDGMYRMRMDTSLIEKVYGWAQRKNALLFLDVQVGHSTMQQELPRLIPFLKRPNVHLGMDAEFSMHYAQEGVVPSKKVGVFDAADVNYAAKTLQQIVTENHLPPKVLIVHRWTRRMITNASQIALDPRVQIVMDMDGWGPPWLKFDSYRDYEVVEPVQFTGFKIFFHHDMRKGDALLTPAEVLRLRPRPLYIQYQ
jgi:hypothetical protein